MRIRYLDRKAILTYLRQQAESLINQHTKIKEIRLFGSLTRQDYAAGSDADLLILLTEDQRRMIDRIPEFLNSFSKMPLDIDCFPLTTAELDQYLAHGNLFWTQALQESILLARKN